MHERSVRNRLSRLLMAALLLMGEGLGMSLRAEEPVDPQRPAAIKTAEVPAVPPELLARLARYQNVRHAAFMGWQQQGQGILVRTRFGNSSQLHRVYQPGGRREQITFFDEPVGGGFLPEADDGAILLSMSQGGNENNQIYLFDAQHHQTTLLTDGKSRNSWGAVLHDGSKMIVHSNRRNGRDTDLYVANPRKPDSLEMLMEVSNEFWSAVDWSRDGRRLALQRTVSANESYPALFDLEQKKLRPLPLPGRKATADAAGADDERVAVDNLTFSPDGESLYLSLDARGEFSELARLDLQTDEYEWLAPDIHWDIRDIEVDPATGTLAFTTNEDGISKLYLLKKNEQAKKGWERKLLPTPLGFIVGLEFSPDGEQLGFSLVRPDAPADAFSLRLADEQLTQWTFSEAGDLDPASFVTPTRIAYPTFDDRQIPAWIYRPKSASPTNKAPVLINIHGGPEGQYEPYFSGETQHYVGELGLAVIYPNVRGSAGYGKTYLKLDNAELREDSVRDIGALLDWIGQQPDLDPRRVAVVGGSYGGYMVLASLVHYSDRIKAGIDVVGIANFITFLERTSPYRQDLRRVEYGDERDPEMRKVFERINPSSNADKIRSALLVVHGVNDPRVPFFEAEQIAEKVRAGGRPVWTVYAENEGHGFAKKDNRDYLTAVEVMFLKQHLGL
ncbi:MAG: S9 family peptidase [Pirellulales bacterium]